MLTVSTMPIRIMRLGFATILSMVLMACCSVADAEDLPWLAPPALQKGDLVMLVAPSGPVDRDRIQEFQRVLESKGYRVVIPKTLFRADRYLAGDDAARAAEINAAILDPNVDAIFPCRGGYGLTRILDKIDYHALRENPKIVIGFSDVTALHLAIAAKARLITFHSPMPQAFLFSDASPHQRSNQIFWSLLQGRPYGEIKPPFNVTGDATRDRIKTICNGKAEGRLIGGNLTLICATLGTPYAIEPHGKILIIEDTGEQPYRIDRYMSQLKLAGVLNQIEGLVVGDFSEAQSESTRIVAEYVRELGIPVISGFPIGHESENLTLPMGAKAILDADRESLTITELPVISNDLNDKEIP